jgi:hypothetical protein
MPSEEQAARRQIVGMVESMLNTPIVLHGKVVDQHGNPVPKARIGYGLLDKFNESGSTGHQFADAQGNFTISGVRGAVIGVSASKEGYYKIHNVSNQSFAYGYGTDAYTKPPPTKENPAVLVLHKMGVMEPLVFNEYRSFMIQKDGTPVLVDLASGTPSSSGQFKVEAWTKEKLPGGSKYFDWKCRLSVPGGGLIERKGAFDFEAPADGYRESDEILMPKDAEGWNSQVEKEYFLRLADGRYARIRFRMIAGGHHFFNMESYLNPKTGSRNLEFDPKTQP